MSNISYHNERLNRTRFELFGIRGLISLDEIINLPHEIRNGVYKCRVMYSKEIEKIEFESYELKIIKSLKLIDCGDFTYYYKYLDRTIIKTLYEQRGHSDDILILKNGFVTDTSYANIVFWDGQNWITPSTPLLHGTKRRKLLDEKKIIEKEIKLKNIRSFEKARIINAMIDLEMSNDIYHIE